VRSDRGRIRAFGRLAALPLLVAAWAAVAGPSAAADVHPEFTANLELAGGLHVDDEGNTGPAYFALGGHTDVMLFRELSRSVGFGFTIDVQSHGFYDLLVAGGIGVLLPIHESFPIVLSGGAGIDALTGTPSAFARIWWGDRNRNQTGLYSSSYGIFAEYVRDLSGDGVPTITAGASVDLFTLLWPVLWIYEAAVVDSSPEVL
jgi:hypothetical protein